MSELMILLHSRIKTLANALRGHQLTHAEADDLRSAVNELSRSIESADQLE